MTFIRQVSFKSSGKNISSYLSKDRNTLRVAPNVDFSKAFVDNIYGFSFKDATQRANSWFKKTHKVNPFENTNVKVIMAHPRLKSGERDLSRKIPYIVMRPDTNATKNLLAKSEKLPMIKLPFWQGTHNLDRVFRKLIKISSMIG